jgi:membrane protease YdiL (CAAX protease family)
MAAGRASEPSLVRRYPIIAFFTLAWVLGTGMISFGLWRELPAEFVLASVLSSSFAGILMTAVLDGSTGLKLLLKRLVIWRTKIRYWLVALFLLIPAILIGSLANPVFKGDQLTFDNYKPAFNILPMFILFFAVSGLGQELGWTGFLLTRLQSRFNALTSCFIRAFLVSIWHIPIFIYSMIKPQALMNFQYPAWITQNGFLVVFITTMIIFMLPWSILFGWLFNNTKGSILLVAILHGSEIWVPYWMLSTGINPSNMNNSWGYGAVMVLLSVIIVVIYGPKNLSRNFERVRQTSE